MRNDLFNFIPRNSFIGEYLAQSENLETARNFDFWGAVWVISILMNRNVYIPRPNAPLYLNFFITLIADSGIARKSCAVEFAKKVLFTCNEDANCISSIKTSNSLLKYCKELTEISNECVFGVNVSEFITSFKNKSNIELMTDFYDCPTERNENGNRINDSIRNVFVSILSGSTPNYYFKAITEEEAEGGFTSRTIIVPETTKKRKIAWGSSCDLGKIKEYSTKFSNYNGQLQFTDSGFRFYCQWYERRRLSDNFYLRSFETREQDFVLKLAGIFAVNENNSQITKENVQNSIKIIKHFKNKARIFIENEIFCEEDDDLSKTIRRIQDIIHSVASNGIKHRDLYLKVHNTITKDEFQYIISTMHEYNMIEILQPLRGKYLIYRETSNLYNVKADKFKRF